MTEFERASTDNFILCMERERVARDYSQRAFSELLGVSLSTYKKIINGCIEKIPLSLVIRMHKLTGLMLFEMIGDYPGELASYYHLYQQLPEEKQLHVRNLIQYLSEQK